MEQITAQEFVNKILDRPGAIILTFTSLTEPKVKKTWNGPRIFKCSIINGVVNYRYEDSVNKQRAREGKEANFIAEQRTWGRRLNGTCFVEHNGKYYITIKVQSTKDPVYVDESGNVISVDELRSHFYARPESSRQGLDNPVITRDYAVESIRKMTFAGTNYEILHGEPIVIPS